MVGRAALALPHPRAVQAPPPPIHYSPRPYWPRAFSQKTSSYKGCLPSSDLGSHKFRNSFVLDGQHIDEIKKLVLISSGEIRVRVFFEPGMEGWKRDGLRKGRVMRQQATS